MKCVMHRSSNMLLVGPKDPGPGITCDDVPATKLINPPVCIATFWQPTPQELELLNANGRVCLFVFGNGHPMVAIEVEPC